MTRNSVGRATAGAAVAGALLAACGSSATPSSSTSTSATPFPSPSPSANPALSVALSASDMPATLPQLTQASDGLLGGTPNTDARVFANADRTVTMEIDVAVDTSPTAATSDYSVYKTAAATQVSTQTSTSTPSIGSPTNEYVGTTSTGHNAVALSFVVGRVICVITFNSSSSVDPSVVESVGRVQAAKIQSANL